MAYLQDNWAKVSSSSNSNAPVAYSYSSPTDNAAAVVASAYFNSISSRLKIGDAIYIVPTDTPDWIRVTAVSPNVTVTAI